MIIMNLKMDNFCSFNDFEMNLSYPRLIKDSMIPNEHLEGFSNFRYRKVNIIMGANASGKTSLGVMMMSIFNFISKTEPHHITKRINDSNRAAYFAIDFVVQTNTLYRVTTHIKPVKDQQYNLSDIDVKVEYAIINKKDSYDSCELRLKPLVHEDGEVENRTYIEELKKIESLSWIFVYPEDTMEWGNNAFERDETKLFGKILENVLKAFDPTIESVEKLDVDGLKNSFIIRFKTMIEPVLIQDGETIKNSILSSGTKSAIDIADLITSIFEGKFKFYYCDEKFSYVQSDLEKAILSVMINNLKSNDQFFFTTHNLEVLDMPLPKHSFMFLKKEVSNECKINVVSASDYLKRNTDSLKSAVDNDLFSISPSTDYIYAIEELLENADG